MLSRSSRVKPGSAVIDVEMPSCSYPIVIGSGVRSRFDDLFRKHASGRPFWVTDENVAQIWGGDLEALRRSSPADWIVLPPGEARKNLATIEMLCRRLAGTGVERSDTLIACGGGVVGDIAGFAAACYLRGIAFVQIPTTLLAMVDASVGGKTGVDLPEGKNLVGAFHQPRFVLADLDFLTTLPEREILSGMGEVVKTAVIGDRELFADLKAAIKQGSELNRYDLKIIERCIIFKMRIVQSDEIEKDVRRILNFGHTVGHALEALGGYDRLKHGEALFWGMTAAVDLSRRTGLLASDTAEEIENLLYSFRRRVPRMDFHPAEVLDFIHRDKKVRSGVVQIILIEDIAQPIIFDRITPEQLLATLHHLRTLMKK